MSRALLQADSRWKISFYSSTHMYTKNEMKWFSTNFDFFFSPFTKSSSKVDDEEFCMASGRKIRNICETWKMPPYTHSPYLFSTYKQSAYQHPQCGATAAMNKHPHAFHLFLTWITAKLRELFFSSSSRFPFSIL